MAPAWSSLWGIILAGGEGERLRGFVREVLGVDKPKQFCAFVGQRTMLERTLRRAQSIIPPERMVIVATAHHRPHVSSCLGPHPPQVTLFQPTGRDTAPGILLPLVYVLDRDPNAIVAILPSDHFVLPGQRFNQAIGSAARYLGERDGDSVVLLGAEATGPETGYGWIKVGTPIVTADRVEMYCIDRFVEKPSFERAELFKAQGWLWNTMVMVARAQALFRLVQDSQPKLAECFSMLRRTMGTPDEWEYLSEMYRVMPRVNLSSEVLAHHPDRLLVQPLRNVFWSDWGQGERIRETLAHFGLSLPCPAQSALSATGTYAREIV